VVKLKGSVPAVSRTGWEKTTKILAWITDLSIQTSTQNLLLTTFERIYVESSFNAGLGGVLCKTSWLQSDHAGRPLSTSHSRVCNAEHELK
jgi:hypothetical protein